MNEFLEKLRKNIYFPLMGIKDLKELGDNYSEDQIRHLATDLKWEGVGTNNDPLIIDGNSKLPKRIMISNSTLFINIVNCQFVSFVVDTCKNISFDKCSFEILGILRSSHIIVDQSIDSFLGLGQSSNNYFRECTISKGFNLNNQANVFTCCVFSKKANKIFQNEFNLSKLYKQLPYFILVYGIVLICLALIYIFNSISLGTDWIFLIGILLFLIVSYLLLTKSTKKNAIKKSEKESISPEE